MREEEFHELVKEMSRYVAAGWKDKGATYQIVAISYFTQFELLHSWTRMLVNKGFKVIEGKTSDMFDITLYEVSKLL